MIRLFIYWEFEKPSQILYLLFGLVFLGFSCFKLSSYLISLFELSLNYQLSLTLVLSALIFVLMTKLLLLTFETLEQRWQIDYKWELIVIFLVFAITGTSSVIIVRPVLNSIGITLDNFLMWLYYPIFILTSFVFYQILLISFGWLFGQHTFFWNMEKKLLKRLGINF